MVNIMSIEQSVHEVLQTKDTRRGFITKLIGAGVAAAEVVSNFPTNLPILGTLQPDAAEAANASVTTLLDGGWDSDQWVPWFSHRSLLTGEPLLLAQDDPEGIISEIGRIAGRNTLAEVRYLADYMQRAADASGQRAYAGNCYGLVGAMNNEWMPVDGNRFSAKAKAVALALKHSFNPRTRVASAKFVNGQQVSMSPYDGAIFELSRGKAVVGRTIVDREVWNVKLFLYNGQLYKSAFGFPARPVSGELEQAYLSNHIDCDDDASWANISAALRSESQGLTMNNSMPDFAVDEVVNTR